MTFLVLLTLHGRWDIRSGMSTPQNHLQVPQNSENDNKRQFVLLRTQIRLNLTYVIVSVSLGIKTSLLVTEFSYLFEPRTTLQQRQPFRILPMVFNQISLGTIM